MILNDLKRTLFEAKKSKDVVKSEALVYLISELQKREIDLRPQGLELTGEMVAKTLGKLVKSGEEVIVQFEKGGRADLVEKETAQVGVFKQLLSEFGSESTEND